MKMLFAWHVTQSVYTDDCNKISDDGAQYLTHSTLLMQIEKPSKSYNNAQLCCRNLPPFQIPWGSKMIPGFVKDIWILTYVLFTKKYYGNTRGIQYWDKYISFRSMPIGGGIVVLLWSYEVVRSIESSAKFYFTSYALSALESISQISNGGVKQLIFWYSESHTPFMTKNTILVILFSKLVVVLVRICHNFVISSLATLEWWY